MICKYCGNITADLIEDDEVKNILNDPVAMEAICYLVEKGYTPDEVVAEMRK